MQYKKYPGGHTGSNPNTGGYKISKSRGWILQLKTSKNITYAVRSRVRCQPSRNSILSTWCSPGQDSLKEAIDPAKLLDTINEFRNDSAVNAVECVTEVQIKINFLLYEL